MREQTAEFDVRGPGVSMERKTVRIFLLNTPTPSGQRAQYCFLPDGQRFNILGLRVSPSLDEAVSTAKKVLSIMGYSIV